MLASTGKRNFVVHISLKNNARVSDLFLKCLASNGLHLKEKSDTVAILFKDIWTENGRFPVGARVIANI